MSAIKFIQQHGFATAKQCLTNCASPADKWFIHKGDLVSDADFDDLKLLVSRFDLIDRLGGINKASELFVKYQHLGESCFQEYLQCTSRILEQAIADYEAIYSEQVK